MEESLWPRILEAARAVGHVNVNGWGENFSHPGFLGFMENLDLRKEQVAPGACATFRFPITTRWQQPESFQLVVDEICWLPGTRFELRPGERRRFRNRGPRVALLT
jgi:hypothetical protein